jgi:Cu/Ag efflux protein CusF
MASERRSLVGPVSRGALGLVLCLWASWSAGAASQTFEGQGRVTTVDPMRSTVTIAHGAIPGLLPATQSEFPVQGSNGTQNLRPGDRIRFTLGAADESHGLLTIVSLTPEPAAVTEWPDRLLLGAAAALALLSLAAVAIVGVLLGRQIHGLQRRVIALDRETGTLRGLVTDTQDGVRQIALSLEEAATTFRVGYVQELRRRLASGAARATPDAAGDTAAGNAAGALIIVQRGRGDLYRAVERGGAGPGVAVIWDRRRNDRRRGARRPVGHERRHVERRGSPPETWTRLGFQLVPSDAAPPAHAPRVLRSASGERGAPR